MSRNPTLQGGVEDMKLDTKDPSWKPVPKPVGFTHSKLRLLPGDPTGHVCPGPLPGTRLGKGRSEGHRPRTSRRGGGGDPSASSV